MPSRFGRLRGLSFDGAGNLYATDITKYAGDVTKATDTLKGLREVP